MQFTSTCSTHGTCDMHRIHLHTYTYIHAYIHSCKHTGINTTTRAHTHVHTYIGVPMQIYTHACALLAHAHAQYVHRYTPVHARMYTHMHAHMQSYIHTYMHTHPHIHTCTPTFLQHWRTCTHCAHTYIHTYVLGPTPYMAYVRTHIHTHMPLSHTNRHTAHYMYKPLTCTPTDTHQLSIS